MTIDELKEYPDELLMELIKSNLPGIVYELYDDCDSRIKAIEEFKDGRYEYKIRNYTTNSFMKARNFLFNTNYLPELLCIIIHLLIKCEAIKLLHNGNRIVTMFDSDEEEHNVRQYMYRIALCIKTKSKNQSIYKAYSDITKIICKLDGIKTKKILKESTTNLDGIIYCLMNLIRHKGHFENLYSYYNSSLIKINDEMHTIEDIEHSSPYGVLVLAEYKYYHR